LTDTVLVTKENQVATLIFNRPDKMNAFNREMAVHLEYIIENIKADSSIRALVLRGAGEVFMAGSDIQELHNESSMIAAEALSFIRRFNSSVLTLREMDIPVLASVHGLVTGTGLSLMLAADLVIASEKTQFSLGFCRLAASPAGGISYNLPRLVGMKKAMELIFLSEDFDAKAAQTLGLINWVVPADKLEEQTQQITDRLVHGPTLAYAKTKQLLNSSWQNKIQVQLELEADSFVKSMHTIDFKNSVRAFINKRQPEYEGR
jgi:2-(1,2-epoxy-1,2-dihydrophenyl)acetyl-CoA isomerase